MALTDDTRIIFIHGLAAKPNSDDLLRLWKKALIEGVRESDEPLAEEMESAEDLFRFAYWANAMPDHIEDSQHSVEEMEISVDNVIAERREEGDDLHISARGWVGAKARKFGVKALNAVATALTMKEAVIDEHAREVFLYHSDQYTADRMRASLEKSLTDAWDANQRIILVSHSMGTFLAYDVLWRFSHRSEDAYRKHKDQSVDLFITMGSPLGDRTLRGYMLIDRWKDAPESSDDSIRRRYYPTNIDMWKNFSAYGDVVCHDSDLNDDFFDGLKEVFDGKYGPKSLADYVKLYNPYVNPQEKRNPHKSYGYLVQPKLSQNLIRFFRGEEELDSEKSRGRKKSKSARSSKSPRKIVGRKKARKSG